MASCNLCDDNVEDQLVALKEASGVVPVRGIRWILDYDGKFDGCNATHVACSRSAHLVHGGDYLRDANVSKKFERGFALLAQHDLSFDLQCCPAQVEFGSYVLTIAAATHAGFPRQ